MYNNYHNSSDSISSSWIPFSGIFWNYRYSSLSIENYAKDIDDKKLYSDFFDFLNINYNLFDDDDEIKEVLKNEAYCFDTVIFAEKFIEAILNEAVKRVKRTKAQKSIALSYSSRRRRTTIVPSEPIYDLLLSTRQSLFKPRHSVFKWPKISEFTIKRGEEKLESYVSQWERSPDWMFCIDFLGFESEDCSNIFVYEVEWSKPTMSYPIPQATASVFFGLEVSKIIPYPSDRSIDVTYVFEFSQLIHKPGRIDFQEKWLEDILNAKLNFFKKITISTPRILLFHLINLTSKESKETYGYATKNQQGEGGGQLKKYPLCSKFKKKLEVIK